MKGKSTGTVKFRLDAKTLPRMTPAQMKKLRDLKDSRIDYTDVPAQPRGGWTRPGTLVSTENKQQVTVRLDADVLAFFKGTGKRYQSRINAALRDYMNSHKAV
jgi:uncharacterized protein (DUF4415 family)